ncbi:ectonucleoside triphosphate diphosphohydrolase 8-like [Mytilus californianus]|uniref:ectonucleoside triphosphate diphosphohydrolase 8-like n=1 Tax=Mytilus californianus TaxID=6549 RepID=UPI0022453075|nr:ectonucleoside triphosphate diphosphohydrolase 8-like [Mytilus californianus]XP_052099402.1 ectonucleoside triphosphate diphosphohydrolase 8-like [Mytilus californianus]
MDIEVNVRINLSKVDQREVTLVVPEQTTVGSFIRKVCRENDIPMKTSYVLTLYESSEPLRWSSRLNSCHVNTGITVVLAENEDDEDMNEIRTVHCNLWWPFAFICFMIGIIGITAIVVVKHMQEQPEYEYGIVMDAGSSHTKLFIYKWDGVKEKNTALAEQIHTCSVPGHGISSYEANPEGLAPGLRHCLREAEGTVPKEKQSSSPVYLGATAGMRLIHEVNSTITDEIFKVVRSTIAEFPFKFTDPNKQARIITGAEEGLYSWVTANYLTGKFGMVHPLKLKSENKWNLEGPGDNTLGAMDMGGASTQMTFNPGSQVTVPMEYSGDVILYGINYTVYTHSYLCFGINEIERKYKALLVKSNNYSSTIPNPCGPTGHTTVETYTDVFEAPCTKADKTFMADDGEKNRTYEFIGSSNNTQCSAMVDSLFNFGAGCGFSECSFNGTYQAPVHGEFYAFSNYFYEMDFLNLTKNSSEVSLSDYTSELTSLCSSPWSKVKNMKAANAEFLPWYCFRGHYILSLLTSGYKFNDTTWRNIRFLNKVNNKTEIGWSLGFMISSSSSIPATIPDIMISNLAFIMLCVLFIIFMILGIGFILLGGKYQKMKQRGMYERLKSYGAV